METDKLFIQQVFIKLTKSDFLFLNKCCSFDISINMKESWKYMYHGFHKNFKYNNCFQQW